MRKSLKIVLTAGAILLLVAVLLLLYFFVIIKDENIYVEDITLSKNEITMKVNDTYTITDIMEIEPLNYNVQVMCYAENSNYLSVVNGYTLKAKTTGSTKVLIKALHDKDSYIDKVLNINIVPKTVYPDSFSFENEKVVIEVGKSGTNKIICSKEYTAEPTITYSINDICTYDYKTGKINALNIGETTVKVRFLNEGVILERAFEVVVSENKPKIVLTNGTFENNIYVLNVTKSEIARLYFKTLDAEGNDTTFVTKVKMETNSVNLEVISYELSCIKFTCGNVGEETIKIYCADDETIFINVKIIVGE